MRVGAQREPRPMEQESDPTMRAACFIRGDVANHTNGEKYIYIYIKQIKATVCTAEPI